MATTKRTGIRRGTTSAPLKNYLSEASLSSIFESIRLSLAEGGARCVSFDYSEEGRVTAITFSLTIAGKPAIFRLPARHEGIGPLLIESYREAHRACPRGREFEEQVERVAWANIRDWIAAQIALVRIAMVKPQEVFLPYMLNEHGQTAFEAFERRLALPGARPISSILITEAQ
jgi:hypothetical protein